MVSVENLAAAVTLDGPQEYRPGRRYRMGLDLGLTHDATALAVAHAETATRATDPPSRRIVLDRLVTFQGRKDHPVPSSRRRASRVQRCGAPTADPDVRADPFQAAGLVQSPAGPGREHRGVAVHREPLRPDGQPRSSPCCATSASTCTPTRAFSTSCATCAWSRRSPGSCGSSTTPGATTTAAWPSAWRSSRSLNARARRRVAAAWPQGTACAFPSPARDGAGAKPEPVVVVHEGEERPQSAGPIRLGPRFADVDPPNEGRGHYTSPRSGDAMVIRAHGPAGQRGKLGRHALCTALDPELFTDRGEPTKAAKAVCRAVPRPRRLPRVRPGPQARASASGAARASGNVASCADSGS